MTCHQGILTPERTIHLDSQLSTLSFVCIPKDWKCLKTTFIAFPGENSNNAVEKLDSTLTG